MKKELNKTKSVFVKKTKMSLAKSTTALTCLIGSLIIVSSDLGAQTTTTGSMAVSTSIASTCTISAGAMSFDPYLGSLITATSVVTATCTNGTNYSISLSENANATDTYYLYRGGTVSATASNQLGVIFSHAGGTMVGATVAITGTGTGATQNSTITGSIAASQPGKTAGSFSRTMTLNLVY